jgi:hypothetical protein
LGRPDARPLNAHADEREQDHGPAAIAIRQHPDQRRAQELHRRIRGREAAVDVRRKRDVAALTPSRRQPPSRLIDARVTGVTKKGSITAANYAKIASRRSVLPN